MSVQTLLEPKSVEVADIPEPIMDADSARRRANGYLGKHVGMFFGVDNEAYLPLDEPVWQVSIYFQMYSIGPLHLGFLDVNDTTGEVISLSTDEIDRIQTRANAFIASHPSATEPPR